MRPRLEPANHRQHSRAEDGKVFQFRHIGKNGVAVAIKILSQSMLSDMDRQIKQLNVLDNFEVVGRRETLLENIGGIDFVGDLFVDAFGR